MKRRIISLILATFAVALPSQACPDEKLPPRNKGNVRYSVRPDFSRFFLLYRGPVQYTDVLQGNTLTVTISGITSAPSDFGSNLRFNDGLIERAFVTRILNSSAKVVLTLREGIARYSIGKMQGLEALIIDIIPTRAASTPTPVLVPLSSSRQPLKQPDSQSSGQTPLVDIAGLARKQVEESDAQKNPPSTATVTKPISASESSSAASVPQLQTWQLLPLALLTLSTLVTIAALAALVVLARRNKRTLIKSGKHQEYVRMAAPSGGRSIYHPTQHSVEGDVGPEGTNDLAGEESLDEMAALRTLSMAEQYQRNQGEVDLAVRLHGYDQAPDPLRKIKTIQKSSLAPKGRVTTAKKLGVGKGEVDLVAKLQNLKEAFAENEGVA